MNYPEIIKANQAYVKNLRRYFHQYPELALEEVETTKSIARELDKLGISYQINPELNTGIIAWIDGPTSGKTITLRADIDALNIQEANQCDYASKHPNKMHACGHDAHIAILLGAAKILQENRDQIQGRVYLLFQPAEESCQGAPYMMRYLNWLEESDNVFGGHVWSSFESGKMNAQTGPRMAASDRFKITIHGKSGHGAQPHQTVDATVVASALVMNLQTIVSRRYSPIEPLVLTVGSIRSGRSFNIISGLAELEGTIRYFSPAIAETIEEDLRQVIDHTCQAYGAGFELEFAHLVPPLINDAKSVDLAQRTIAEVMGPDCLADLAPTTGGEDFAYYLREKPGAFIFIGTGDPAKGTDVAHHNERFDVDDDLLSSASLVYAKYAINFLKENN